jgi:hypothetical protein
MKPTLHAGRAALALILTARLLTSADRQVDVCVYGGTAAGVIAAAAAADEGRRVLVIEPGRHLGGMTGGGIGTIDYGVRAAVGGLTHAYFARVHPAGHGAPAQPELEAALKALLAQRGVEVVYEHRLAAVRRQGARIAAIELERAPPGPLGTPVAAAEPGPRQVVAARVFIDAGYEGDLMVRAGVPYASGREAAETYHEGFAGRRPPLKVFAVDPFRVPGDPASGLLPLVSADDGKPVGAADDGVPACNFRLQLSREPVDRAPFPEPSAYDAGRYELLGRLAADAAAKGATLRPPFAIYGAGEGAGEFNDDRDQLVSLAMIGGSRGYVDGDYAARARSWQDHLDYTVGLFRFLATDPRIPAALRAQMAEWGPKRSAFPETAGWPHQLYIRQGRRMLGAYVVTQGDLEGATTVDDGIGLGTYKIDVYNCRRVACAGGVAIEGKVFTALGHAAAHSAQDNNGSRPYPIPYRALTPRPADCDNLLVPVCLSCSHIACASIRMEPVYMVLGEAAGRAAAQAVAEDRAVQAIDVRALRDRLAANGQVLALP